MQERLSILRSNALVIIFAVWVALSRCYAADLVVAGYLPDYRFYIDLNQTALHLSDLYLFSIQIEPSLGDKMLSSCCLGDDHFRKAEQAAAYKKEVQDRNLNRWITIGGGGRSEGLKVLHGRESYQHFLKALQLLSSKYGLMGIDFDHEALQSRENAEQYFQMILTLAPSLHKMGISVSMAIHAGVSLPEKVYKAIDRINVMAYDFPFAGLDEVEWSINNLLDKSVPSKKLFLGIPAYGRHRHEIHNVKTFAEIVDMAGTHDVDHAKGAWSDFMYDSTAMVQQKVNFAKEKNLGGVFIWELGQDKQVPTFPGGILLEAVRSEASNQNIEETTNEL